jgi:hypothetical protein
MSLYGTGVSVSPSVNTGAYIMLVTAISYIVIQVPGIVYLHSSEQRQVTGKYVNIYKSIYICKYIYTCIKEKSKVHK